MGWAKYRRLPSRHTRPINLMENIAIDVNNLTTQATPTEVISISAGSGWLHPALLASYPQITIWLELRTRLSPPLFPSRLHMTFVAHTVLDEQYPLFFTQWMITEWNEICRARMDWGRRNG
jgi:hypothetical protein